MPKINLNKCTKKINPKFFVWYALCITLLAVSSTDIYVSSLPQMTKDFKTSPNLVNLTISLYTLTLALAVLFVGILSNHFGRKKTILSGILAFTLASFLIGISNSIPLMIIFRVVQAIGCACIAIVPRLVLKDTMSARDQVHAVGILTIGIILSPAIAPSIGAVLAELWGWRSCFFLSGISGAILFIAGNFIVQETNTTPAKQLKPFIQYIKDYFSLLNNHVCICITVFNACTFAISFVFIGISSYLFIDTLHMAPLAYSYLFIVIALGYFSGNSIMMILNKRQFSSIKIMRIGIYASSVGLLVLLSSIVFNVQWAIIICVTLGVVIMRAASALIIAPAQVKILEHFQERGVLALGLSSAMQFTCASLATSLVAVFYSNALYGLLGVSAMFFLPTVFLMAKLRKLLN
jgi:predicted MFS family arabinose efflux permease